MSVLKRVSIIEVFKKCKSLFKGQKTVRIRDVTETERFDLASGTVTEKHLGGQAAITKLSKTEFILQLLLMPVLDIYI